MVMMNAAFTLILAATFTAPALAQAPPPLPAPAPRAAPQPPRPPAPHDFHIDIPDFGPEMTRGLEEGLRDMERALRTLDLDVRLDENLARVEAHVAEMAALAAADVAAAVRQLPVPPVPPVPPRDPRQAEREKQRPPRSRFPQGWVESTEPFSRTFKVGRNAALLVSNVGGNIQVSPGGNDQVEVQAMKHAWAPNAEQAKERLADAVIEAYATATRVELRVEYAGRKDGRGVDIEFDIKIPTDASVELRTVSGDIRVTNIKGEVRVQGVSGNLHLDGTPRLAVVKTVSGDIMLANAGADAQLAVSSVSGDLLAQTLTARSVDLNTVNGDVRLGAWTGDRALIRTLDGDIDLQTSLTKGGRYEIESHSGDIFLSLPEQPGFDLDTHTFSGKIRIDFPIKSEGPIRDSDRGPRSIRGTYGDASSSLRVQTFSGDLTVTRR